MAVPEQTPYKEYTANGTTTEFPTTFDCESKDHLIVMVDDNEVEVSTWQFIKNSSNLQGSIKFNHAPANGLKITIQRNSPARRESQYSSYNNSFRPQAINEDLDRIWRKLQEFGVADILMKLYVDRLHQQQEQKINDLKGYVDDRDDELRAYLLEEIRKQGVALDQLDDYYNYLMQRLAQIAVDKGWSADFVVDGNQTQAEINLYGGKKYDMPVGGYPVGAVVILDNGEAVKSLTPANTTNPNVDMTNWEFVSYAGYITPEIFGAKGDGIADDTAALTAAALLARRYSLEPERRRLLLGTKKYRITSQINLSSCAVESLSANILKDFSGTGVLVAGGGRYTDFYGELIITGHGDHYTDGYSASIDPDSHGIQFSGRVNLQGSILVRNHWGHGVLIDAYSNMNKSTFNLLRSEYNARKGIYGKSINNDTSVWTIKTQTYGNYDGGVYLEDTFAGRQFQWYLYNEASRNPEIEAGVYLGRLRRSDVFAYTEEQGKTNPELIIGSACEDLDIHDTRNNRTLNLSPTTCHTRKGAVPHYRKSGEIPETVLDKVFVGFQNLPTQMMYLETKGAADLTFLRDTYVGNGGWFRAAFNPAVPNGKSSSIGVTSSNTIVEGYSQTDGASLLIRDNNGSLTAPTQKLVGEYACNLIGSINTGAYTNVYRIRARLTSVGSGNKASADLEFGTASSADGVQTKMTLRSNGTLDVPAGLTPFTGLHKAYSNTLIETGLAVDVVSVTDGVMNVEVCSTANSKRCAGVVNHCEEREDGGFDVYVAASGDNYTDKLFGFKVTSEGGLIEAGDILVTSNMAGHLCKATDTLHESVTRFKAMEDAEFVDGVAVVYGYFK